MENKDQGLYAEAGNLCGTDQSKNTLQWRLSRFCKTPPELPTDATYSISDFLAFHDHDFIINAYQVILGRSPDSDGYHHYLNQLRQGRLTKIEILGRLRFSAEGRSRRVKIHGLLLPLVFQTSFRLPAIGHILALVNYFLRLPSIIRNFVKFESHVHYELSQIRNLFDANMVRIEELFASQDTLKANRNDLEALERSKAEQTEIEALKRQKADIDKVQELAENKADWSAVREELDRLAQSKAERDELEALERSKAERTEIEDLEHRKADIDQVQALAESKAEIAKIQEIEQNKADNGHMETLGHRLSIVEDEYKATDSELKGIIRQVNEHKQYILDQQRRLTLLLEEARKRLPDPISQEQIEKMVQEEDHLLDAMYVSFEDQFRGTREDIKNRVSVYLPYIMDVEAGSDEFPVLDIGCGRGEWLELLKDEGLISRGFDLNRMMVQQCLELGLQVEEQEAGAGLRKLPSNSLGAITGLHIIEHLPFKQMIALFDEALRVVKPGGVVIFETPNPENLLVGAYTFYSDPTHKNPLPPHFVQFLVEARGFVRTEILRLHPNEALEETLSNLPEISVYFTGPQDYAVIAYKAG